MKPGGDATWKRLGWDLGTLWMPDQRKPAGLHTLIGDIDRLFQREPAARGLSSRVAELLSDLTLVSECQQQIKLISRGQRASNPRSRPANQNLPAVTASAS